MMIQWNVPALTTGVIPNFRCQMPIQTPEIPKFAVPCGLPLCLKHQLLFTVSRDSFPKRIRRDHLQLSILARTVWVKKDSRTGGFQNLF
jgi:hypothetical protein